MVKAVLKRNEVGLISIFIFLLMVLIMVGCGIDFEPSFGIHPSSLDEYAYAKDLGIDFNREGVYFIWEWVDTAKNGNVSFKHATIPPAGASL